MQRNGNCSNDNLNSNVNSVLAVTMPNVETNICLLTEESIPYMSYYEMTMDDFEEHLINNCYGVMENDENNAIDYNKGELTNNNTTQSNIVENNDSINKNTVQTMFNEYRNKEIVHQEMKDTPKYSIELLALLKNSSGTGFYL